MSDPNVKPFILVVEDDEHIGQLLKFMLARQGYGIELATDGRIAKAFIETSPTAPALVLMDIMLPYHDGFELVRIIRTQPSWADTPILMLTAKTMEEDIVRALDAGANDYIVKPFQPQELMARMRRFLRDKP